MKKGDGRRHLFHGCRFQKRNLGISMEQRSPIKASHRALACGLLRCLQLPAGGTTCWRRTCCACGRLGFVRSARVAGTAAR
jgi:hypothetical protein